MLSEIRQCGAELVAISPQHSKYSEQIVRRHDLEFPVLGDPGNVVARSFGVAWELPDGLREAYLELGLDLERYNGDDSWTLPMPARFIVDAEGIVRSVDVHPDYTTRPEPSEILEILKLV